jgi:hypothetical protein
MQAALQELVGGGGRVRWWTLGPDELSEEQRAELEASGCEFALNQERIDALSAVVSVRPELGGISARRVLTYVTLPLPVGLPFLLSPTSHSLARPHTYWHQSALDLRFLGELMRSGYSEEVIVKWSLHPEIGPKIRSGEWFAPQQLMDALTPEAVREAWKEAQEGEMEGKDFSFNAQDPPHAPPKVQRQPGVPPKASPRGKKFPGPRRSNSKGRAAPTEEGSAGQSS